VSVRRVVTALRGSREGDLDRERAEVDTAASALVRAESERDALRRRVDGLRRDLQRCDDAEAAYEQALADVVSAADVSRRAGVDPASGPGPTIDPLTVVRVTNLLARRRERRDRMGRASERIENAQAALVAFGRELDDLGLPGMSLPTTDGLTRGVDIWFDNVFTDLRVRGRIRSLQPRHFTA
jgi:septal ring factor EnvC (AmiA/AmiB activator)